MEKQDKIQTNNHFGLAGYCLVVFLFFLYANAVSLYGLKFAAGASVSWLTGAGIWFLKILFQSGDDPEGIDKPFCWHLFLLFPLFVPLALPIWLIPTILVISYLIAVASFGGQGKQIFNPVIVAVVFMLYGYGNNGLTEASRPFPASTNGYTVWTSGIPPRSDIRDIYSSVPASLAFSASIKGSIPNIPGSCYSSIILIASLVFSLFFKRCRIWWIVTFISILLFAYFIPHPKEFNIPFTNICFLGIMPSLFLCAIADITTLPKSVSGQIISALIFAGFAVLMIYKLPDILAPAYAFLLSQVFSPLIIDIIGAKHEQ